VPEIGSTCRQWKGREGICFSRHVHMEGMGSNRSVYLEWVAGHS